MGAITAAWGAKTTLTTTALNSLASANYVAAGTVDLTAVDPLDVAVEVEATPGTVAGNKQLVVFAKTSFDGTDFSTGPASGSTATDEPDLYLIGVLPLGTNSTLQRKSFSVVGALGFIPPHLEVIVKNDCGAALAASGHKVSYALLTGNVA